MKGFMSLEGGGPMDGEHTGVLAWAVQRQRPDYFCTTSSDIWHHYVNVAGSAPPRYVYAGLCDGIDHDNGAPDDECGHAELPTANDGSVAVMGPESGS